MFKFKKDREINRSHKRIKNFLTGLVIFLTLGIGGLGLAVVGVIKDAPGSRHGKCQRSAETNVHHSRSRR